MPPSRKQAGCCTLCGKEVFEVRARYPSDHSLAGEVRQIGAPLSIAHRATILLMSGTLCNVTLCSSCKPTPANLPRLWTICMEANARELDPEYRAAIGASEHDERQRHIGVNTVRNTVVDLPIAVLEIHRWEEDDDFTARSR